MSHERASKNKTIGGAAVSRINVRSTIARKDTVELLLEHARSEERGEAALCSLRNNLALL